MARRKKLPLPPESAVEAIVWKDHASFERGGFDTSIIRQLTIGALVFEDDEQIDVFTCGREDELDDLTDDNLEGHGFQILKADIISRTPIGVYKHGG